MAKILAIDDKQENLTVLSRLLDKLIHGCTVITAQSGTEGMEKAIAELPDTILLDIIMPGVDGYEVCKRLKSDEKTKHIPVIMLTGIRTDSESRVKGLELGADAFLTKPIDEAELAAQVKAMLRIKRAEDLLRKDKGSLLGETEEEIRVLAEFPSQNPNPVLRIGRDGTVLYANDASEPLLRSWGCQPGQRLPDMWYRFALDVFSFGSSANKEVEFGDRVLSLLFAPVEGGDYVNVYGFDVTERRRLEELLKERETQLFQSQKMEALGTLVTGVAHEINNPISLIMFNVPLLQEIWHDLQPVVAEYARHEPDRKYGGLKYEYLRKRLGQLLDDMDLASNRVANTVNGLKNFARQSDVADKKPMLVNEAVRNAVQLSQTSVRKAGIDMVANLSDDLAPVNGNSQAMEQIILNLILNAVEATDNEHGRIEITSGFEEREEKVFVSVSDNGHGVDPDIARRIFDPFVTSKMAEGGIGLGLAISHNLVRAHSGLITFQSIKGKGTIFTVSFPSALKEKRAKILVVHDDREIREDLADALATLGPYLVYEAPNGIEACMKLRTHRPDLIVLDIFMPEMDGLEVCRNLRREPELSHIKVLITTAFPDHPKVQQIAELGFRDVCYKPFTTRDFVNRVDECLQASGGGAVSSEESAVGN
jgi:CheY-like chemotaxis protein